MNLIVWPTFLNCGWAGTSLFQDFSAESFQIFCAEHQNTGLQLKSCSLLINVIFALATNVRSGTEVDVLLAPRCCANTSTFRTWFVGCTACAHFCLPPKCPVVADTCEKYWRFRTVLSCLRVPLWPRSWKRRYCCCHRRFYCWKCTNPFHCIFRPRGWKWSDLWVPLPSFLLSSSWIHSHLHTPAKKNNAAFMADVDKRPCFRFVFKQQLR